MKFLRSIIGATSVDRTGNKSIREELDQQPVAEIAKGYKEKCKVYAGRMGRRKNSEAGCELSTRGEDRRRYGDTRRTEKEEDYYSSKK